MSRAHAFVFGSSSGLGAATAALLKRRGHVVSGFARGESSPEAVDASFTCDVTKRGSIDDAVKAAVSRSGPPDLLVYSAGAPAMGKTLEVSAEAARMAFEVNFWGLDNAVRAVLPMMVASRRGAILALSSIVALRPVPYESYYAASKAAADRYLGCLAHEALRDGVHVKFLHIGSVDTGFAQKLDWFGMSTPKRAGSGVGPDDVAAAALRLLESSRMSDTFGWKENAIAIADRIFPELYDRLLRFRR